MSVRKPMAALAAVTAALALAIPSASASAATTTPAAHTGWIGPGLVAGSLPCQILVGELRFASASGNIWLENYLGNVFVYSGCGGAAI
jgi:hypothetical protein